MMITEPDFAELPHAYGIDECEIAWRTPHTLFAWWELTEAGLERARTEHPVCQHGRRVLRLFIKHPRSGDREHRDFAIEWNEGRQHLPCNIAGATVRVAIGLVSDEGLFVPLAHSSVVRLPPSGPDQEEASRWAIQRQSPAGGFAAATTSGAPIDPLQPAYQTSFASIALGEATPPRASRTHVRPAAMTALDRALRKQTHVSYSSSVVRKETHGGR